MIAPDRDGSAESESAARSSLLDLPVLAASSWQMSFGERAAIEGVVSQLEPRLALEIGTAQGGSLRRISAHSGSVISFDLVEPDPGVRGLPNVELRTGDSHVLLGQELARIATGGESVDLVLVDGDHSADGARRDIEDLLASNAVRSTVILAHDTLNQEVRRGLAKVPYSDFDKVAFVDLDFVGGYVPAEGELKGQCWGGLGLIVVDESGTFGKAHAGGRARMAPLSELVWPLAEALRDGTPIPSSADTEELERQRRAIDEMRNSISWRLTAPLRIAKARLRPASRRP